jgi:superfamily II DNA or RNA helicase
MKPIRFGAQLEVPLEYLDMTRVEEELTIENKSATIVRDLGFRGGKEIPFVSLYWLDTEGYVHLPRNYSDLPLTEEGMQAVMQSDYLQDTLPTPAQASWKFRRTLRPKQVPVAQALLAGDDLGERDKLLCISCGMGKSVLALWYAAQRGLQTLIIVDSDFLAAQWETQINKCLWVDKKKIGRIQGDVFNVQPITIAMLQTLGRRIDNLHKEFFDVWGLVIFDECHVASAPQASRVLPCFPGSRLGLSATPTRQDGLEPVFMWHLGGLTPFYVDLEKEKPARWCFKRIPRAVSEQDEATCWRRVPGRTNRQGNAVYSLMRSRFDSFAAKSEMWNDIILQDVIDAVDSKRQSIVLGTRVAQLTELCTEAQRLGIDAGLVVGDVKGAERKDVLDSKQVIFATAKLASKALDVPRLDTLFILYPTTDANFLRQASGRISREHGDKQEPTVVVYSHGYNDRLLRREGEMKDAVSQIDPGATISVWGRET